jgi:hypothetical protein
VRTLNAIQLHCNRLQEKFVKVATMYKDKTSPEESKERIRAVAFEFMSQSVTYEDIADEYKDYGGFKKKNVRAAHIFSDLPGLF